MEPQLPTLGRIVHFHLGHDAEGKLIARAATVVRVWPGDTHGVNLQVHLDGGNDERVACHYRGGEYAVSPEECARGLAWRTSVAEGTGEGTWSWPPRA
jgi:hypothetical protein